MLRDFAEIRFTSVWQLGLLDDKGFQSKMELKRTSKILKMIFEEDNDPKGISSKKESNFIVSAIN